MSALDDLLALLPDNSTGDISAADMRTIVTALYPASVAGVLDGPFTNLPITTGFAALPGAPGPVLADLPQAKTVQLNLSAYIDSGANSNDVALALDLSGATALAAGSNPEQVLRVGGKQPVASTLSLSYLVQFSAGQTGVEVRYSATAAGADISAVSLTVVSLG